MDQKFIIQQDDVAKFKITITHSDFDQQENDFWVVLNYGMLCGKLTIPKSEMYCDEDGDWYFVFSSEGMTGLIKAECHYMVNDEDVESGYREELDYQYIGFVTANPCPQFQCEACCEPSDEHVVYDRVWRSDVKTLYLNVRTSEGENVLTSEGEQVRVRKTQAEIF